MANQIYVLVNGQQQGPYTLEQVKAMNIAPDTQVWAQGMETWMAAEAAPVTAQLFGQAAPVSEPPAACPNNNLVWAIVTMLCCCQPLGVVALVNALQVGSKYAAGDYEGAVKCADNAKKWSYFAIGGGVLVVILYSIYMFIMIKTGAFEH